MSRERLHNPEPRARVWILPRLVCLAALLVAACGAHAQTVSRYQMFGGYSYLSNSLNGVSGHHHALTPLSELER